MADLALAAAVPDEPADAAATTSHGRVVPWRDFVIYSVVLAVAVAALGMVITLGVTQGAERNALLSAREQADLVYRADSLLGPLSARGPLAPALRIGLARVLSAGELAAVEQWTVSGGKPHLERNVGAVFASSSLVPEVAAAVDTHAVHEMVVAAHAPAPGDVRSAAAVIYPLRGDSALAVLVPYDALAARTRDQVFRLDLLLAAGFALLYAIVLLIAWSAGRRLRFQLQANLRLAGTDALTDLPNRQALVERLTEAVEAAERSHSGFALALADADRFKEVNDILGHEVGDQLIAAISARLRSVVKEPDVVARIGGDEFAFLFLSAAGEQDASRAVEQLREILRAPVDLEGLPIFVEASIGVALYPGDGTDAATLLRHADLALYAAKDAGTQLAFFDPSLDHQRPGVLVLGSAVRHGLDEGDFCLYYQPKVELHSGRPVGAEALLRWNHPTRGVIEPSEFLPLAERTSLIFDIGAFALRQTLAQLAAWGEHGGLHRLSVNVSARSLREGHQLDALVLSALEEFGVSPERLCLEVTETALVADGMQAAAILGRLVSAGVRIALDDFGRGYTSIGLLKTLPLDELKIDKEYVERVGISPADRAIVESMVELAHALGIEVTAEGVESEEVLAGITAVGCDFVQGNLVSGPLPIDALEVWLEQHQPLRASPPLA